MCNIGRIQKPIVESSYLKPPTMSQMVGETVHSRRVNCLDLSWNAAVAFVGVALLAFSVAMLVITAQNYGWVLNMIPIYAILGVAGFGGLILSGVSIKRMIDYCRKSDRFEQDVREIT